MQYHIQTTPVWDAFKSNCDCPMCELEKKINDKNIEIVGLDTMQSAFVNADEDMIQQVVYNLINNAINYTGPNKTVRVVQSIKGDVVRVSVIDSGEGISEENLPLIWDRYYKVDKVHRRATVGTGLGLSIVKGVLEAHNATYGVTSSLGNGSTFWFELKTADSAEYSAEIVEI